MIIGSNCVDLNVPTMCTVSELLGLAVVVVMYSRFRFVNADPIKDTLLATEVFAPTLKVVPAG